MLTTILAACAIALAIYNPNQMFAPRRRKDWFIGIGCVWMSKLISMYF